MIKCSFALLLTAAAACAPSSPRAELAPDPTTEAASPTSSASTSAVATPPTETSSTIAATATPTATASVEPPKMCTKIGCASELVLPLVWGKDTLTSSKYTFELTVDGKKGRCEIVWPYKSCSDVRAAKCSGEVAFTLETSCTGAAKSTSDMVIGPLRLSGTPAAATLKVWREKIMWHQQELTLNYADLRPNGAACEPLCKQASRRICIGSCEAKDLAAAPPDVP
jgi:hypothetical protein